MGWPKKKQPVDWTGQPLTGDPMFSDPQFDPMGESLSKKPLAERLDPFTVDYGPGSTAIAGGYEDPRGMLPSLVDRYTDPDKVQAMGVSAGLANREKIAGQKLAELGGHVGEVQDPGAAGQRIPSFGELMQGIPMWQGGGGTTVQKAPLSKGEAEELGTRYDIATGMQKRAIDKRSAAQSQLARDQAHQARQDRAVLQHMDATRQEKEATIAKEVASQMAENNKIAQEVKEWHYDPERIYKGEYGGLKKLAHVIGMALGAAGATLGRTPNFALQIVNDQLSRDAKAQFAELSKKKWSYQQGRNMLADLYQKKGDIRQAFLLEKQIYLDIAATSLTEYAAQAKTEEAKASALEQKGAVEKERAMVEQNLMLQSRDKVTKHYAPRTMTPAAATAAKLLMMQRLGAAGAGGAGGPGPGGANLKGVPTTAQTKLNGAVEALAGLKRVERALLRDRPWASGDVKMLKGKDTRRFDTVQNPVLFNYVRAMTGVAGGEKEREQYRDIFIKGLDPSGLAGERTPMEQIQKLAGIRQAMLDVIRTQLRSYPQMRYMVDPESLKASGAQ